MADGQSINSMTNGHVSMLLIASTIEQAGTVARSINSDITIALLTDNGLDLPDGTSASSFDSVLLTTYPDNPVLLLHQLQLVFSTTNATQIGVKTLAGRACADLSDWLAAFEDSQITYLGVTGSPSKHIVVKQSAEQSNVGAALHAAFSMANLHSEETGASRSISESDTDSAEETITLDKKAPIKSSIEHERDSERETVLKSVAGQFTPRRSNRFALVLVVIAGTVSGLLAYVFGTPFIGGLLGALFCIIALLVLWAKQQSNKVLKSVSQVRNSSRNSAKTSRAVLRALNKEATSARSQRDRDTLRATGATVGTNSLLLRDIAESLRNIEKALPKDPLNASDPSNQDSSE